MTFSEDQLEALKRLDEFVFDKKVPINDSFSFFVPGKTTLNKTFLLKGKPGVGKTTVIKEFINRLKNNKYKDFIICAPTHKAARVLSDGINEEVLTIHKLLELSPVLNIIDFDLKDLKFSQTNAGLNTKLLIIDESSMINDHLYDTIIKKSHNTKIIFIADFKQLKPVKSKTLSKVSGIENNFELTTNHRQDDNAIIKLVEESRNKIIQNFEPYESENIEIFTSAKALADDAIVNYRVQSALEYEKFCKILTYTNNRVESFNKYVHSQLSDEEYHFNEILTGYSSFNNIIQNSEDFLVKCFDNTNKTLPVLGITVEGYNLMIKSMITGVESGIFILSRDTSQDTKDNIAVSLENIRLKAMRSRGRNRWSDWYKINDSFCTPFDLIYDDRIIKKKTLDYGYATTLHRSQGSTYDLVYYDNNSIQFCYDLQEKRQLQHVALSRVSSKLNILI